MNRLRTITRKIPKTIQQQQHPRVAAVVAYEYCSRCYSSSSNSSFVGVSSSTPDSSLAIQTRRKMHSLIKVSKTNHSMMKNNMMMLSTTTNNNEKKQASSKSNISLQELRVQILDLALTKYVHETGWTQDTISSATQQIIRQYDNNDNLSSSSTSISGMIKPENLIEYCMDQWNVQLKLDLTNKKEQQQQQQQQLNKEDEEKAVLVSAIKTRLEYTIPYIKSNQWVNGMALGLRNPLTTQKQLHQMVDIIFQQVLQQQQQSSSVSSDNINYEPSIMNPMHTMIGAIYVATELHLLTDKSLNYQDTWEFLNQRVHEFHTMKKYGPAGSSSNDSTMTNLSNAMFVIGNVTSSFVGAILSLTTGPNGKLPSEWLAMYGVTSKNISFVKDLIISGLFTGGRGNNNNNNAHSTQPPAPAQSPPMSPSATITNATTANNNDNSDNIVLDGSQPHHYK